MRKLSLILCGLLLASGICENANSASDPTANQGPTRDEIVDNLVATIGQSLGDRGLENEKNFWGEQRDAVQVLADDVKALYDDLVNLGVAEDNVDDSKEDIDVSQNMTAMDIENKIERITSDLNRHIAKMMRGMPNGAAKTHVGEIAESIRSNCEDILMQVVAVNGYGARRGGLSNLAAMLDDLSHDIDMMRISLDNALSRMRIRSR